MSQSTIVGLRVRDHALNNRDSEVRVAKAQKRREEALRAHEARRKQLEKEQEEEEERKRRISAARFGLFVLVVFGTVLFSAFGFPSRLSSWLPRPLGLMLRRG